MECLELLIGERGYCLRIAAGVMSVGSVGKKAFLYGLEHQGVRRRIGSLHFIIDYAGDGKVATLVLWVGELQMMTFLIKTFPQKPRLEDKIGIDPCQIEKISACLTCHGIDCFIGIGEGLYEGLHWS